MLRRNPENIAETGAGAWLCASGSQEWIGASPALVPYPTSTKIKAKVISVGWRRTSGSASRVQSSGLRSTRRPGFKIFEALIGDPKLIIVDEPTAGLDPEERNRFHNLISETAGDDTIVILSTHIVSDVANLCSSMAIIREGKILASCTPRQAVDELKQSVWEATVPREKVTTLKSQLNVLSSHIFDGQVRVRVISQDHPGEEFAQATPVLEDFYFDLVNR